MYKNIILFSFLFVSLVGYSQDAENLFAEMETVDAIEQRLLPDRMLFTQRLLWGEKASCEILTRMN